MILDNSVMDDRNPGAGMRMRINVARFSVGCPAGMSDPAASGQRFHRSQLLSQTR